MRVGIAALLHESNTFAAHTTTIRAFEQDVLATGDDIHRIFSGAWHEVGGFFSGLADAGATAVPLFAARALPSGPITASTFDVLLNRLHDAIRGAMPQDGILVAPHGATVSEHQPDADGYWLAQVRQMVGKDIPIIGTLDAHANLSPAMVSACDALIAYRSNPHLDQRQRGEEAARMIVQTLEGRIRPVMAARFPPFAISIDRQCTEERHLRPLYELADQQLQKSQLLSNSILLGFPYADVAEMGSAVIAVSDDSEGQANRAAAELASAMWAMRDDLKGIYVNVDEALAECLRTTERCCLLDMGDNVGGGSGADGTQLAVALHAAASGPSFVCLCDPQAVSKCRSSGPGSSLTLSMGGRAEVLQGGPFTARVTVQSLHTGRFRESRPRHGGFTDFDQGPTAVVTTDTGLTIMLTSRRMVPFSLQQLIGSGLNPQAFRILVAKGVNAPLAAYQDLCPRCIRVNTAGSTCADMTMLPFTRRRRPLFPFETDLSWDAADNSITG